MSRPHSPIDDPLPRKPRRASTFPVQFAEPLEIHRESRSERIPPVRRPSPDRRGVQTRSDDFPDLRQSNPYSPPPAIPPYDADRDIEPQPPAPVVFNNRIPDEYEDEELNLHHLPPPSRPRPARQRAPSRERLHRRVSERERDRSPSVPRRRARIGNRERRQATYDSYYSRSPLLRWENEEYEREVLREYEEEKALREREREREIFYTRRESRRPYPHRQDVGYLVPEMSGASMVRRSRSSGNRGSPTAVIINNRIYNDDEDSGNDDDDYLSAEAFQFSLSRYSKNALSPGSSHGSIAESEEKELNIEPKESNFNGLLGQYNNVLRSLYTGDGSIGGDQNAELTVTRDHSGAGLGGMPPLFRWM